MKKIITFLILFFVVAIIIIASYSQKAFVVRKIPGTDGVTLWTEHFGDESKPALLLIAGSGASCRFWHDSFCKELAKQFFVIRYDHRDCGFSSAVDFMKNPYTLEHLMYDSLAVLEGYHIASAHVVGHSMGGYIAQMMAMDFPSRVRSVTSISAGSFTSIDPAPDDEKKLLSRTQEVMNSNRFTQDYEESVDGFLMVYRHLHGTIPLDEQMARTYVKDLYQRSNHPVGQADKHVSALQASLTQDKTLMLKNIEPPMLIIHGALDPLQPLRYAQKAADAIGDAHMKIIPDMGHMIFDEDLFGEIADIISQFITSNK